MRCQYGVGLHGEMGDGVMYEEGGCPFYLAIGHCSTSGNMLFMRRTISCPPSLPLLLSLTSTYRSDKQRLSVLVTLPS